MDQDAVDKALGKASMQGGPGHHSDKAADSKVAPAKVVKEAQSLNRPSGAG
jgi:hypothetical protein